MIPAQRRGVARHWNRPAHAPERLHEECKRRITTQIVLPSAGTAAMLFCTLLASVQVSLRTADGWQTDPGSATSQGHDRGPRLRQYRHRAKTPNAIVYRLCHGTPHCRHRLSDRSLAQPTTGMVRGAAH